MKCMTQEEIDKECEAIRAYSKILLSDPEKAVKFFDELLTGREQESSEVFMKELKLKGDSYEK